MNLPISKHSNLTNDIGNEDKPIDAIRFIDVETPEAGKLTKVAEDIFWLRMPLPFDLNHINLYLINDVANGGYVLIDTGLGTKTTQSLWDDVFTLLDKPITKVIVTHMHPDHIGMAGYIVDRFRAPLLMSHSEYFVARALFAGPNGASDWQDDQYLLRCGFSESYREKAAKNRKNSKGMGQTIKPIPLQFERLQHNDEIVLGSNVWKVIVGRGHSPEHVCLFNKKQQILVSGDHILPKISPNIGVYSTEPEANTLNQYLSTLPQFLDLPNSTLVLPSHKRPFLGLHARVNQLIAHHNKHLARLSDFCKTGKTVEQCLEVMFKRKLNPHNMFFATAEALSHLNYLYFKGAVSRDLDEYGHYVYTTSDSTMDVTSKMVCG